MVKKVFAFIFILFIITAVTGFAGGQVDKDTGSKDKIEITYTRWAGTQEARDFQILVDKFMEIHPEIKVKTEFLPWGAYWEKLKTSILSGDAADVISLSQKQASPYITKGAFLPLNTIEGAAARLEEMQPGTKEAVVFKDNICAMPVVSGP
jgi:multiple sugar transport system substrate-binding protein